MKFNFTTILLVITLVIISLNKATAQTDKTDSLALVDLYNSTNGNNWGHHINWLTTNPVSTWDGVTVSGGRVTKISLYNNLLSGTIMSSIGNLSRLKSLSLGINSIAGTIPNSIGNLTNLTYLDLQEDQFTGSIPASVINLIKLTDLLLNKNKLSGTIPDSIGNLVNLLNLDFSSNNLSGVIPSSIGNLTKLGYLNFSKNQLTGNIPTSIGTAAHLYILDLSLNKLTGQIPPAIGNFPYLQILTLYSNQLNGHIPATFGNFVQIIKIYLDSNRLTGEIPRNLLKLKTLQLLSISNNLMSQSSVNTNPFDNHDYLTINMQDNHFNFTGIESILQANISAFYSPQKKIRAEASGNSLHVNAGGTLSNNTYTWYKYGEKTGITIVGDSIFHPTQNGTYYVTVTNVVAKQLTLVSELISYNAALVSSTQNNSKTKAENIFAINPNPAKGQVNIQLSKASELVFIDVNGNVLFTKYVNEKSIVDISNLSAGSYYIKNKSTGEVRNLQVIK